MTPTTMQELLSNDYAGSRSQATDDTQPEGVYLLGIVGFDTRRQRFVLLQITGRLPQDVEARPETDLPQLSEREQEVLQLVAAGASNLQVARRLFISQNTVKVHLRHIFEKLEVQSRTEAAMVALRQGWVNPIGRNRPGGELVIAMAAELGLSPRTFYRKRRAAVEAVATVLWQIKTQMCFEVTS